jgi:hypothetical protein
MNGREKFYTIRESDIGSGSIFAFDKQWAVKDITSKDVGKRVYQMHGALHWEPDEIPFQVIENPAILSKEITHYTFGVFNYYSDGRREFIALFNSVKEAQQTYPHAEWHGFNRTGYVS